MKLVILEDHVELSLYYISKLIEEGIVIERLLYFDNYQNEVKITSDCKKKFKDLGVKIDHVDILNFLKIAQNFYENKENIFLFDVDLDGDRCPLPEKIQIAFARQKLRIDKEEAENRFFFYSTFPSVEQYAALKSYFSGKVIECRKAMKKIDGIDSKLESTILLFKDNSEFCSLLKQNNDR